jgi:hypothetical protein
MWKCFFVYGSSLWCIVTLLDNNSSCIFSRDHVSCVVIYYFYALVDWASWFDWKSNNSNCVWEKCWQARILIEVTMTLLTQLIIHADAGQKVQPLIRLWIPPVCSLLRCFSPSGILRRGKRWKLRALCNRPRTLTGGRYARNSVSMSTLR